MKPFFTFYGGKWRAAPHYPSPLHDRIIEPFAGAAGYSVRHFQKDVILVEKDPTIAGLWRYLIKAEKAQILKLPLIASDGSQSVDDLDVAPEERWLIGFWLNKGTGGPCRTPSAWMRGGLRPKSYWGIEIRARIADQVERIKHWTIINGDYAEMKNEKATWFIDPPYQVAGAYKFGSKQIDFHHLGNWCQKRFGQVIVCENEGAAWLPFQSFITIKANESKNGGKKSAEVIWKKGCE